MVVCLLARLCAADASAAAPSDDFKGEQSFPSRYPYVVQDILKHCNPNKGLWIDVGAGKGQLTIPLVEAAGNTVVMLDPNKDTLAEGLEIARGKGLADRLVPLVGVAEQIPFPDNTADLVVSRGSIFFWDDPAKGLQEIHRVLRPGAKAYVGGGAGSGYPKSDVEKLIQDRKRRLQGPQAEKWKRFVELRRPEQMRAWAQEAKLTDFTVLGQGAIADDPTIGQGVWLVFEKKPRP